MYNKNLITEINRGLELMGLPKKNVLNEQALWKFWKSVEDLLTGAKNIPQSNEVKIGTRLDDKGNVVGGVEVPKTVYNDLRRLIGNGDVNAWNSLDQEAKIFLSKIIMTNPELYNKIYNEAISDFLANEGITKTEFLQKIAKDLDEARESDPLASLEDIMVRDGVDPATAKLIDGKLTDEVKPYMKWSIDDVKVNPKIISSWKNLWSVMEPKALKSVRYKWMKGYLKSVQEAKKKILEEMGIIQAKLQRVEGGEAAKLNIKDNLNNIMFLIAGMRRSGSESSYADLIKKYISENDFLPKDQVEEFMKQDWVQNSIKAAARSADEESIVIGTKTLQAFMESVPVLNFFSLLWRKGGFKNLNLIDYFGLILPNFKRLFNYAVFRTPLYMDEIAELSLRTGRNAALVETAASFLLFETVVKPSMLASLRTILENWVSIPQIKEKIELIRELCTYGAIRDEEGNIVDCEDLIQQIEYKTFQDFKEYWKQNIPFNEWTKEWLNDAQQKYEKWGVIGIYMADIMAILDGVTYADETMVSTWENVLAPVLFRKEPAAWEEWRKELESRYNESMKETISKLKSSGFNTEDPKVFEEQLIKKIDDLKRQYPEIEKGAGNFSNDLEGFKKWLRDVNKYNEIDRQKAKEFKKVDEKTGKKIYHYFLIDGAQPITPENPKYIWFPNKTFYPEGQSPIQ